MKLNYLFLIPFFTLFLFSCGNKQEQSETKQEELSTTKELRLIDIKDLKDNAVSLFADNWFVVTAGDESDFNQLTISWGALGQIWGNPSATIYIRNTRYTYPYLNNNQYFTLCAFDEEYRDKVSFIGSKSGRDVNKVEATGLTPKVTELGSVYYDEARLVIECEKVYFNEIIPANILIEEGQKMYDGNDDTHRMYIGKIVNVWEKK